MAHVESPACAAWFAKVTQDMRSHLMPDMMVSLQTRATRPNCGTSLAALPGDALPGCNPHNGRTVL